MDAAVWHATVFTHNRDRLLEANVARAFLAGLLELRQVKRLLSSEHFSVDGTLIDAWASMKSFRPRDGSGAPQGPGRNGERDFRREKRSNETHASATDPDARLYRKAAERETVLTMFDRRRSRHRITLGADKAYDVGARPREVLADKGYDADDLRGDLLIRGVRPVTPWKANRRERGRLDRPLYALRNRIERAIGHLKQFRRVATRYDKTAGSFLSFVQIAAIHRWMRFVHTP